MRTLNTPLRFTNLQDGETVHQRCLIIAGWCTLGTPNEHYIHVTTKGAGDVETFPEQTWPTASGQFRALVMLSPGLNILQLEYVDNDYLEHIIEIKVNCIPLLHCPPLHLAIMVASDSPCVIDCPPQKAGGTSSAHSDLNAADTVSRDFFTAADDRALQLQGAFRSTAKVHVVRSSKSLQEIQDPNRAQQNPSAYQQHDLFDFFLKALKDAGGPFAFNNRPIVAGLILDSHYNISQDLILGHASLHCHNLDGISLGMFGSHLTYSWPRFLEEVTACLKDTQALGDRVGNDFGDCTTMWEACALGQGAFLLEIGHAFGLHLHPAIRETGYYQDWPKHFLSKTPKFSRYGPLDVVVDVDDESQESLHFARWDLADALALRMLPHFHLPTDPHISSEQRDATPSVEVLFDQLGKNIFLKSLHVSSYKDGIARISFNYERDLGVPHTELVKNPRKFSSLSAAGLEHEYDTAQPLHSRVLGANGKETIVEDVWKLLAAKSSMRIADGSICLTKHSVSSDSSAHGTHDLYEWAQLLREKGADGTVHRAISIDLQLADYWDGGVAKYSDGHTSHWGPMRHAGKSHHFGGHPSPEIEIPANVEISCVEINKGTGVVVKGVRLHLSNGTFAGDLNDHSDHETSIVKLEPAVNEVIVGFFGKNERRYLCGVVEFGIITVPKCVGLDGLPESVYDLPELKNMAGMDEGVDV